MTTNSIKYKFVLPVLMSFFVMSFVDMVGIGVDRVKLDFNLTDTMAQLIPSAAFLWFLLLSVSVGIFQDRIGKKMTLNLGMLITAMGLFLPVIHYTYISTLIGFAFLGIGNTIVQVSANPLLADAVPDSRRSSFLSLSQFIKAIGSMIAPALAGMFATRFGDWKLVFLAFGIVSLLTMVWMASQKISESKPDRAPATLGSSFRLLGNPFILMMVLGIFVVVGIDVGMNSISGQFFMQKLMVASESAEKARSIYFFGRMLGTFGGAILLARMSSHRFLLWSSILSILFILVFMFNSNPLAGWILTFIIGLTVSNIFPLIYSITIGRYPDRSNEISGLMIMAVSGGGLFPPIMGWLSDNVNITASIFVLVFCAAYLVVLSFIALKDQKQNVTEA
ncbi:sugar MFS transporter [Bacteroidota bacterium]